MVFQTALVAVSIVCVIWTVLPIFRAEAWYIRAFEFPRTQVLIACISVFIAYAFAIGFRAPLDLFILSALGLCIFFQAWQILPYTRLFPAQVSPQAQPDPHREMRIVVANVLMTNRNAEGLINQVTALDPDFVLAVEGDDWWQSQLDVLENQYPHTIKHPLDNLYGMHVYSKLPLSGAEIRHLVEESVPSIKVQVTLRSGDDVTLFAVHPRPPSPTENASSLQRDAELLMVAKEVQDDTGPAVVIGDLNDVAWSATTKRFQRISGLGDPRIGRGLFNSFHAKLPIIRWPLDHMFCSAHFGLNDMRRLKSFGSDHFPLYARFVLLPTAPDDDPAPPPTAEDHVIAADKITRA